MKKSVLAIETSSEQASAALLHGDQLWTREVQGVSTHSQTILPMVQSLLQEAGLTLAQCDAIAFGAGPGAFTGVRTACGIAQGLAFGCDLPVVPVVTLQAMAQACHETSGVTDVLTVLDARMGEVYWAQYRLTSPAGMDCDTGIWEIIVAPTLSAATAVVPVGEVVVCGNGVAAYAAAFEHLKTAEPALPHAAQIARLGRRAYLQGETVAARDAQPFYLRNKVALTTAERAASQTTTSS